MKIRRLWTVAKVVLLILVSAVGLYLLLTQLALLYPAWFG